MDSYDHLDSILMVILCFEDSFQFKDPIIDHCFQPVPLQEFFHNPTCICNSTHKNGAEQCTSVSAISKVAVFDWWYIGGFVAIKTVG